MSQKERSYPTDVSDEEWEFCAPYLTLMREDAPQREHALAGYLQRCTMDGEGRLSLAIDAIQPATVESGP